jgi:hypothetical protein
VPLTENQQGAVSSEPAAPMQNPIGNDTDALDGQLGNETAAARQDLKAKSAPLSKRPPKSSARWVMPCRNGRMPAAISSGSE